MKRVLLFFSGLLVLAAALTAEAYTVSGRVAGGQSWPIRIKYVIGVPVTFDTILVTIALPGVNTYVLPGVPEGSYFLGAYQDLNQNLTPDLDEPRGFYGGDMPQILIVRSDTAGIDIELREPTSGGFSGRIIYHGSQRGTILVQAYRSPDFTGLPRGFGLVLDTSAARRYTALVDSFGTYYAFAFMDVNTNLGPDEDEPYGVYGGRTPAPIVIEPTNFPDNVDITLEDRSALRERQLFAPQLALGPVYPNPFNSTAVVSFALPDAGTISLSLYDVLGRRVQLLADGPFAVGEHTVVLDGSGLPAGIYFLALRSNEANAICKIVLLK